MTAVSGAGESDHIDLLREQLPPFLSEIFCYTFAHERDYKETIRRTLHSSGGGNLSSLAILPVLGSNLRSVYQFSNRS